MVFELTAQGWKSTEVRDELNAKGFKTRILKKWGTTSSGEKIVVDTIGGIPMETKKIQSWLKNPAYAGFKKEKWTCGHLIQAPYAPIVSIELWNKANKHTKDKLQIIKDKSAPDGWSLVGEKDDEDTRTYSYNNPDFPFKDLIICPKCGKNLKGSSSKGKSGNYFPTYHYTRGHSRVSINPTQLEETLRPFFARLQFKSDATAILQIALGEVWKSQLKELNRDLLHSSQEETRLREKCDSLLDKIEMIDSPDVLKSLIKRHDETKAELKELAKKQNQKRYTEQEIDQVLKYALYFVEHLDELVLDTKDIHVLRSFWGLIFPKPPTLEELQNGTPQISPIFELKDRLTDKESFMAAPGRIELPLLE